MKKLVLKNLSLAAMAFIGLNISAHAQRMAGGSNYSTFIFSNRAESIWQ